MDTLFALLFISLLCLPALAPLARRWKHGAVTVSSALAAALLAGAVVAAGGLWRGASPHLDFSAFFPLPFTLGLDSLSSFFLFLICVVSAPVALFSGNYVEQHYTEAKRAWFWALLPWFIGSMAVVVTASTAFVFLFGWELMTVLSAGLILIDGDSEQRRHDLFIYLVMMHAGAAAVVTAFLLFIPGAPALDFATMRAVAATMPRGMRDALFLLSFVGFGTKAGLIPLHLWLPRAHPMAPTPVSALMSGVMLKTAVYGFVRVVFDMLGGGPSWWGYVVLAVGAVSGVLGILYAIAEHDLKRLLAYSSVENIGIIFLGLGAALLFVAQGSTLWATLALLGALLHTLNHALFKSALFLGAGAVGHVTHTFDLEQMGGLQNRMPLTGTAFLIACCSIVGLPFFNGFVSEWLTFRSLLAGSTLSAATASIVLPLMSGVLALIGGLAAACFAKVYGVAFLGRARHAVAEHATEVPLRMSIPTTMLAGCCALIGIAPGLIFPPLAAVIADFIPGATLPGDALALARVSPWIALAVIAGVAAIVSVRHVVRVTPTWSCGLPGLDGRMQYTSTSFSKPLRKVFSQVYRPERTVEVAPANATYFPAAITYRSVRTTSFERALYRPVVDTIVAGAHRLRQLQTGNIQVYLLYIFLALIALLLGLRFA